MIAKNFFVIFFVILFTACSSTGLEKNSYYQKLGNVNLGMSKTQFRYIFPNSIPRGAKQYKRGSVEVLEVSYSYYSFMPTGNRNRNELTGMEGQAQWFYFYNGKLIQYGNSNDWPSRPDLIIEKRFR